jgi:hypothetical protein
MLILMKDLSSWIESLRREELCRWDHVAVTKSQPLQSNFLAAHRNRRNQPYRDRLVIIVRTDCVRSTTERPLVVPLSIGKYDGGFFN